VRGAGDAILVAIRLSGSSVGPPLYPSALIDDGDGGWREVLRLDALVAVEDDEVHIFRTEQAPTEELQGRTFRFQQWWTPHAFYVAADTDRSWENVRSPDPQNHVHCVLDQTTIEAGEGDGTAWRSGNDWVCSSCYQRYIVEDRLGIRETPPTTP